MAASTVVGRQVVTENAVDGNEAYLSGISWAAVIAGAFVTASLWVILSILGTGLGASAISPWSNGSASASTVGKGTIIWLIIAQIIASSMGGYLAGRLRIKWATIHTDEVYFRDTAHGFLVWAVGLVMSASFLTLAATSMVGAAAPSRTAFSSTDANGYFVDLLLHSVHPALEQTADEPIRRQTASILAHALAQGDLPAADEAYLSDLVIVRTGLSRPAADQRVITVFADAQQAAENARRALAHLALWLFVALLIGAFCASYAATIGGRERDHVKLL